MALEQHFIVDGPNVMHAWPHLRPLLRRSRNTARERLISAAMVLHDAEGCRVTLVFDGRGAELTLEHPAGEASLTVIFTPSGLTADDVIEQMVAQSREPQRCVVVTADAAEKSTIESQGGAVITPLEFAHRITRAGERVRSSLAQLSASASARRTQR